MLADRDLFGPIRRTFAPHCFGLPPRTSLDPQSLTIEQIRRRGNSATAGLD
jgi:hypothetical protein